jgi:HlyD family secretion protein
MPEPVRPILSAVPSPTAASNAAPSHPPPDPEITEALQADHRRSHLRRGIGVAVGVLAVVGIAVWVAQGTGPAKYDYVTKPVERGTLVLPIAAAGAVEPKNAVDVGADISGRVAEVLVDANDQVKRGDLLAVMQTDVLDLAVKQARAGLTTAQANRRQAEIAVKDATTAIARADALKARGAMSASDHDQAQSAVSRANAALTVVDASIAAARTGLEMAQANRAKAEIRAPISGIVLRRSVEPGQVVISALQAAVLFRLAEDLSHLQVRADIDEADIGRIKEGQAATFTVSAAPNHIYTAHVRSVTNAPRVTMQQVVTYEAILDVDNADGTLRPGMTATIKIRAGAVDDALIVPALALRFAPAEAKAVAAEERASGASTAAKSPQVWVLDDTTPVAHDVVVVASDGERTAVTGLEEGAAVIISARERP